MKRKVETQHLLALLFSIDSLLMGHPFFIALLIMKLKDMKLESFDK